MTIAATVTSQRFTCNGATTQFSFPNKIFSASDLTVTLIDTLGNQYPFVNFSNSTLGLSYTVQNVDVDTGCLLVMSAAPANLWTLDIRSNIPETQSTSIKNQGPFLPELHEEAFDRATRTIQDLYRKTYTFGIHGPDIESTPWPTLPSAATRANLGLVFDVNGNPTVGNLSPAAFNASQSFTATAGQTVFTLSGNTSAGNIILVSLDGAVLTPGDSYTASGQTLTLLYPAMAGQELYVVASVAVSNVNNQAFVGQLAEPNGGNVYLHRSASYSGGPYNPILNNNTPWVNSALRLQTDVSAGAGNFEWTLTSIMNNSATAGSNVAIYGQGNRQTSATGPTWAGVMEAIDNSGQADPTVALLGIEVDCRANGTDSQLNRVPIHIVGSRPTSGGADVNIGIGILIDNNGDGTHTSFSHGILLGNKFGGTCQFNVGLNLSQAQYTQAAIALPDAAPIWFDGAGTHQLLHANSGLQYKVGGAGVSQFNDDGSISYGGSGQPIKMLGTTAATATVGGGQATPATVLGYKNEIISGTNVKIPYYAA
jgi:hypothetical protein